MNMNLERVLCRVRCQCSAAGPGCARELGLRVLVIYLGLTLLVSAGSRYPCVP